MKDIDWKRIRRLEVCLLVMFTAITGLTLYGAMSTPAEAAEPACVQRDIECVTWSESAGYIRCVSWRHG